MKIGVVGLGYWGPNLIRNFLANKAVEAVIGYDKNIDRLKAVKSKFPGLKAVTSMKPLLNGAVDAIALATPVGSHYSLAKMALEAGKHVWVEKPFTATSRQAEELIEIAERKNLRIFVDHTFIYTGAVRKIKELVEKEELGEILYFDSVRINLGLFQHDVNVIWDLVPHDLSIMKYVLGDKNISGVTANGIANYFNLYNLENIANISVYFENHSCFAHFHVNWTSPVKIRRIIVGGTKKMLVYDDMENSEKVKVYDCGVDMKAPENIHSALVQYRVGDMYSPKITQVEALEQGVQEFIEAIRQNRTPKTSGHDGLEVVKILEAADHSLKNQGKIVPLRSSETKEASGSLLVDDIAPAETYK